MKKSKISILLLFLVMILAMSAVSAADTNETSDSAVQAVDEAPVDEVASDSPVLSATDNADVLSAEENNFTSLQTLIDSSDTVLLDSNYVRVDGDKDVSISKDLTIIGNNHVIDADNKGGIFNIQSGCSLTLIGVTLINGNADNGGAIYNNGTLSIISSNLLNNTATYSGGAIYNNGGSITISGSTIDGNDLSDRTSNNNGGAAIYDEAGKVLIADSYITNNLKNIVHRGGTDTYAGDLCLGAITTTGNLTVSASYFANNSGNMGGAICSAENSVLNVVDSTFENNFAFNGGAINFVGNTYTISGSTFKGNQANGTGSAKTNVANGGAICSSETAKGCLISDCTFENNGAARGGAISCNTTEIDNCTFISNVVDESYEETFNGVVNDVESRGEAVYVSGDSPIVAISDSTFEDNNIYLEANTVATISNNVYNNQGYDIYAIAANIYFDGVGDLPSVYSGTLYFNVTNFTALQNIIDKVNSSTIHLTSNVTKLASEEEAFADGIVIKDYIILCGDGYYIKSNNGKVFTIDEGVAVSFSKVKTIGDGTSAVINNGHLTLENEYFENVGDYAIENNGIVSKRSITSFSALNKLISLINGGTIKAVDAGFKINKKYAADKEAFKDGIVIDKNLTIIGYTNGLGGPTAFMDAMNSGRIFNITNGATLTLKDLILRNGNASDGGAVYVNEGATFIADNVYFNDNTAVYNGGAISVTDGILNITNCLFDGNDVTEIKTNDDTGGAAIFANKSTVTIADSKITNNGDSNLNRSNGDLVNGVLNIQYSIATISGSVFENNTGIYGGAITAGSFASGGSSQITITESNFTNNKAYNGGAIYIGTSGANNYVEFTIEDCLFTNNNKASGTGSPGYSAGGGAIEILGDCEGTITNITVKGSQATDGGAIGIEDSKVTITESTFEDNIADSVGGAIFCSKNADLTVSESTFKDNTAKQGTIFLQGDVTATISGNFINNTDTGHIGVIVVTCNGDVTVENSNFTKNIAGTYTTDVFIASNTNVEINDITSNTNSYYSIFAVNGNLSMSNNNISAASKYPIYTSGSAVIISTVIANVSEGKTYNTHLGTVEIDSTLTDDSGNFIRDANFNYVITKDGEVYATVTATFYGNPLYSAEFEFTEPGTYVVSVDYESKVVDNATYVISASLTDLKNLIGNASAGDTITLGFDYAYIEEFDAGLDAIVIDKDITIDGKGYTINASETSRNLLIIASGVTATLDNITFTGVEGDSNLKYGAVVNHGSLTIEDCTFIDNSISKVSYGNGGAAVFNDGTSLTIVDSEFINNTAPWKGSTGAVSSWADSGLLIKDSYFEANSARFGGAVEIEELDQVSVAIDNCTFFNNTAYQGGALNINDNAKYVNITGSNFNSNSFKGPAGAATTGGMGGAINAGTGKCDLTVEISGSVFESNYGDDSSGSAGAAVRLADKASGIITDCEFISNYGCAQAAVAVGNYYNDTASLTLKDSSFYDNNATCEGLVFVKNGVAASVENCTFWDNDADYDIYNEGILSLSNNTFPIGIYSDNAIQTTVKAIFLGGAVNNTINAVLYEKVTPYAILTDDNGNPIYDPKFNITVAGEELVTVYDEANQAYFANYTILSAGNKTVSTNYAASIKTDGTYVVPLANVTEFIVKVGGQDNHIPNGANATVYVTLRGTDGEGLNENLTVIVNNNKYNVTVSDGEGSFNVSGLEPGDYVALSEFKGNSNYNGAIASSVFYVLYPDPKLSIISKDISYGAYLPVEFNLTDAKGNPTKGTVLYSIIGNSFNYTGLVAVDGLTGYNFPNLKVGTYTINATLIKDNYYGDGINDTKTVEVTSATPAISILVVDENIEAIGTTYAIITVADGDATGNITVDNVNYTLVNGSYKLQLYDLVAGDYKVPVVYLGDDNYNKAEANITFTVVRGSVVLTVTDIISQINLGENVTFTVTMSSKSANGTVTIYVDGVGKGTADLDNDYANVSAYVANLAVGTYTIGVKYNGNDNFNETEVVNFTAVVNKAASSVTIDPISPVDYGNDTVITFNIVNQTDVNITVTGTDGTAYSYVKGDNNVTVSDLPAGTYTITINNAKNANYTESEASATFIVNKIAPAISVVVDNINNLVAIASTTLTVTVGDGKAKGKLVIEGLDDVIYVNDFNGVYKLPLVLNADEYEITATFMGNENYTEANKTIKFNVTRGAAEVNITDVTTPISVGGEALVAVSVKTDSPNAATGNVTVYIDGVENQTVVLDDNNEAIISISGLAEGTYTIGVKYNGNENYNASEIVTSDKKIVVEKISSYSMEAISAQTSYGHPIPIMVSLPNDAVGNVSVTIYGNNYNDTVERGFAIIYGPSNMSVGNHTGIVVTYSGSSKYVGSSVEVNITIVAADSTLQAVVVNSTIDYEQNATIMIDTDSVYLTGDIDVYDNGNLYDSFNSSEVVGNTIDIQMLKAGTHNITLAYEGNEYYAPVNITLSVVVNKITPEIKANATQGAVFGNNVTIDVNVSAYTEGNVSVSVDNVEVYNGKTDNGIVSVDVKDLAAGKHTYVVKFLGDENYLANTYVGTVEVAKATPTLEVNDTSCVWNNEVEIPVKVTGVKGAPVTGKVTVRLDWLVDAVEVIVTLDENGTGIATFTPDQALGNLTITATYLGNDNYTEVESTANLTVNKSNVAKLNVTAPSEIVYNDTLNVNVDLKDAMDAVIANATILYSVDGAANKTTKTDDDGQVVIPITGLNAGKHTVDVYFADDYYDNPSESIDVVVNKAVSSVYISIIPELTYGDNVTVSFSVKNKTNVTVKIYNMDVIAVVAEINITDGFKEFYEDELNFTGLAAGNYSVLVINNETDNYKFSSQAREFTIAKADPQFTSEISENITFSGSMTINVTAAKGATGSVTLYIDDDSVVKDVLDENGTVTFTIDNVQLNAGSHSYKVVYEGDGNYTDGNYENSFEVAKADITNKTSLNVTAPANSSSLVFSVTLPEDATGYLLVDIDGKQYYAPVENGTANVTVKGLLAGNYTANVTYSGDDKYNSISNVTNVTLPSNLPENAISLPTSSSTYNPTYGVNLPSDATGYIVVDVDGKRYYATVENGAASVSVPGLSVGNHNVTVTYSGDDKYTGISKSANVTLTEPVIVIKGSNVKGVYSAAVYYKALLTIDGKAVSGKTVTFTYNGKTYSAVTDANGYATLKVNTKVKPGKYTITAKYGTAATSNKVKVKHILKAKNKKVKKSKKVNKVVIKLKKVNGKYLKNKKIKIKFKGKTYKVKTNKKGKAVWKVKKSVLKKLKVGKKYKYKVKYGKDKVTKKLKIKK